jgi:glutamate dehydrogenase
VFWNGGIGTVVKASTESDAEALDRSSDAIRVDAASCAAASWPRAAISG